MKKLTFSFLGILFSVMIFSQEKMYIHKADKMTLGALLAQTDSIFFSSDGGMVYFRVAGLLAQYAASNIDSISFGANSDTIFVTYNGSSATIINPLAFEGVTVTRSGADVIVNAVSETRDINVCLTGTSSDGSIKIYNEKRFNLLLNSVSLTNADGPAINIQGSKNVFVTLTGSNTLADGTTYAAAPLNKLGVAEDQKAAFFSEGSLLFDGAGSLSVKATGTGKHAICSDDSVVVNSGSITVASSLNDGIHTNEGVIVSNGTVNVTSTRDAIDGGNGCVQISGGTVTATVSGAIILEALGSGYDPSHATGIKSDSIIRISGGNITITNSGSGGRGISSDQNISITGGTIKITTSGAGATYKNSSGVIDSYSAACLSCNGGINILSGNVTLSSSGSGGKGITAEGALTFGTTTGTPVITITTTGTKFVVSGTNYCHPKAIVSTGAILIDNGTMTITSSDDGMHSETSITQNNGSVTITNSYEGVESKFIYINGGYINVTANNDGFNATAGTVSGGTESNDGSCLYLKGGTVIASCTNGDAIDSNGSVEMSGGTVLVHGPTSAPEEGADFNGTFKVSGGIIIASGSNSNMNKAFSTSSSQRNIYVLSSAQIAAGSLFHIEDASANNIITFKPVRAYYSILFSSSSLQTGVTYSIYTGGSSTGTLATGGLYTGGTYSGGTLKKSFTLSTTSTVTSVTF